MSSAKCSIFLLYLYMMDKCLRITSALADQPWTHNPSHILSRRNAHPLQPAFVLLFFFSARISWKIMVPVRRRNVTSNVSSLKSTFSAASSPSWRTVNYKARIYRGCFCFWSRYTNVSADNSEIYRRRFPLGREIRTASEILNFFFFFKSCMTKSFIMCQVSKTGKKKKGKINSGIEQIISD